MQSQTNGYNMGIVFTDFQRRSTFRQGIQIHVEKIHREFTVDVM